MQEALDFRAAVLSAKGCEFTASMTANYGDKAFQFALSCICDNEDGCRITVTEPASIANITGTIQNGTMEVEFDGMTLDFGELADGHVIPLAAPEILAACWRGEYISATGCDGDMIRVTYLKGYDDEEVTVDTYFSGGEPVKCELSYDGKTVVSALITNFSLQT